MTSKRESDLIKESLENLGEFFRNMSSYNSVYSDFFGSIELAEKIIGLQEIIFYMHLRYGEKHLLKEILMFG